MDVSPRWRVAVQGAPAALEAACAVFKDADPRFARDGPTTFMESPRLDDLDDAEAVLARATPLIDAASGGLRLMGIRERLASGNVVVDLRPGGAIHLHAEARIGLTVRHSLRVIHPDGGVVSEEPEDTAREGLAWAMRDEDAMSLLSLVGKGTDTWTDLYRIHERLEALTGRFVARGLGSESERRLFRWTANSRAAIGDEARHGADEGPPPPRPMTLEEARAFVLRTVRDAIHARGRIH